MAVTDVLSSGRRFFTGASSCYSARLLQIHIVLGIPLQFPLAEETFCNLTNQKINKKMPGLSPAAFKRPRFTALPPKDASDEDISSIPDLIRFNGLHNPDRIFCIQSESSKEVESFVSTNTYSGVSITYKQLDDAVFRCVEWLRNLPAIRDGMQKLDSPIALYLESDVGLFIHMMALQTLNIPVCSPLNLVGKC